MPVKLILINPMLRMFYTGMLHYIMILHWVLLVNPRVDTGVYENKSTANKSCIILISKLLLVVTYHISKTQSRPMTCNYVARCRRSRRRFWKPLLYFQTPGMLKNDVLNTNILIIYTHSCSSRKRGYGVFFKIITQYFTSNQYISSLI